MYWGSPAAAGLTIFGMSWVAAALPWWRRENVRVAAVCLAGYLLSTAAWWAAGYPLTERGDPLAYALNAISRLLSQSVLVVAVAWPLPFPGFRRRLRSYWDRLARRFRSRSTAGS